jgi:hypothetical protein
MVIKSMIEQKAHMGHPLDSILEDSIAASDKATDLGMPHYLEVIRVLHTSRPRLASNLNE